MELNHSTSEPAVRISNHGRITIPAKLRKKYHLQDGDEVVFIEDEGSLRVIKILSIEELQSQSISAEEMMKIINNSHEEEIELENK